MHCCSLPKVSFFLTPNDIELSAYLAGRTFRALRVPVDLHQLHEASFIVGSLMLLGMADSEGSLYIDLIGSEWVERVVSVAASGGNLCILRSRSVRATHDLGEEASETKTDGRHAAANDANLTFDD